MWPTIYYFDDIELCVEIMRDLLTDLSWLTCPDAKEDDILRTWRSEDPPLEPSEVLINKIRRQNEPGIPPEKLELHFVDSLSDYICGLELLAQASSGSFLVLDLLFKEAAKEEETAAAAEKFMKSRGFRNDWSRKTYLASRGGYALGDVFLQTQSDTRILVAGAGNTTEFGEFSKLNLRWKSARRRLNEDNMRVVVLDLLEWIASDFNLLSDLRQGGRLALKDPDDNVALRINQVDVPHQWNGIHSAARLEMQKLCGPEWYEPDQLTPASRALHEGIKDIAAHPKDSSPTLRAIWAAAVLAACNEGRKLDWRVKQGGKVRQPKYSDVAVLNAFIDEKGTNRVIADCKIEDSNQDLAESLFAFFRSIQYNSNDGSELLKREFILHKEGPPSLEFFFSQWPLGHPNQGATLEHRVREHADRYKRKGHLGERHTVSKSLARAVISMNSDLSFSEEKATPSHKRSVVSFENNSLRFYARMRDQ